MLALAAAAADIALMRVERPPLTLRFERDMTLRRLVRRAAVLLAASAVVLIGCDSGDDEGRRGDGPAGKPVPSARPPSERPEAPAPGHPRAACDLPTVRDRFIGFRVGRPSGWQVDATGGAIVVKRDPAGKTLALIYPVVPEGDTSASELFRGYSRVLGATAAADGGGLDFVVERSDKARVEASLRGRFAGSAVRGRAAVSRLAHALVFSAYWAPEGEGEERRLAEIVSCYRKEDGRVLQRREGQFFAVSLPEGWSVTGETQNGIDVASPSREAGVSFAYATNLPGRTTPEAHRDFTLRSLPSLEGLELRATQNLGTARDELGTEWSQQASEFAAHFEGRRVRGVITVAVGNTQFGSSGAMASIRVARADRYDELAGAIAAIQRSIVLTSSGSPGAGLSLPPNRPDENPLTSSHEYRSGVQDRLSQDWQEAIMGYDNLQSPSTGDRYQVPLNNYDPAGPDGPGYYRPLPDGGSERLQESSP